MNIKNIYWIRTDLSDGASETLCVVKLESERMFFCSELGREYPYLVQVTTGPEVGDDLVGLYDLDGDQVLLPNDSTREIATDVPKEVIEHIETAWEGGLQAVWRQVRS